MSNVVSAEKLLEAMGNSDWTGLISGREATIRGNATIKQIAAPLGKPCLAIIPTASDSLRFDPSKRPAAFASGSQSTLVTFEEERLLLERKGGGLVDAIRAVMGQIKLSTPKRDVHQVSDRQGADLTLKQLIGVNSRGKTVGMRSFDMDTPSTLVIYDARGTQFENNSLEDGDFSPLRRLHVMLYPNNGVLVTAGNLDGGADKVTIDSVQNPTEAARRVADIVNAVQPDKANEIQSAYDSKSVRIGGKRGVSVHFDVRTVLELLGGIAVLLVAFGFAYAKRAANPPAWLTDLISSRALVGVAVVLALVVYALASGILRDKK